MELLTYLLIGAEIAASILLSPLIIFVAILSELFSWIFFRKSAKSITGEIAVVTGGANGLGREICIQLAIKGCHVAVVDIDLVEAEKTARFLQNEYNTKAKAYKVDVANHDEVLQLSQNVTKDLGVTTILVNNAAMLMFSKYLPPNWQEVQNMINVNLMSHFWTLEGFLPKMKELKRGHVVAIASLASFFPLTHFSQYTATKFALRGLMRCLRLELRIENFTNIHTTIVMPYFLNSNRNVANFYEKTGYSQKYPIINCDNAAESIIDGMLLNKKEIGLPSVIKILCRLFEILPTSWQDRLVYKRAKNSKLDLATLNSLINKDN